MALLVGCPSKTKILYLKFSVDSEANVSDLLASVGKEIQAPLGDEKVGLNFLQSRCEHRRHKSESENTLLGICVLKTAIYIYALLPDHGNDPQKYLGSSNMAETLSMVEQYKKNVESYLKVNKVIYQFDGYHVDDKSQFMRILDK